MLKKLMSCVVLSLCAVGVSAESPFNGGPVVGPAEQSVDVLPMNRQPRTEAVDRGVLGETKKGAAVTEETVGDPYSFGAKVVYLGLAQTEPIDLMDDCTGYPPENGRCIETNPAPAPTFVDEADLGSIVLPGKSTKTLLCFTITPIATWEWFNSTTSQQTAQMSLRPTIRIENDALADPSLINPVTGMPFNGVIELGGLTTYLQYRTLDPNHSELQRHVTTRSCIGGLVSEMALRDGYGLSNAVIKDFFKTEMTVRFGAAGTVSMTTFANYFVGVRLYGDK